MTNEEAREILKRVEIAKPIKFEDYADMREALDMAIKALEQEPKTGHWVLISNKELEQYLFGLFYANNTYMNYKCSGCGFIVHNTLQGGEEKRTQYCPNCGAKMEGAE